MSIDVFLSLGPSRSVTYQGKTLSWAGMLTKVIDRWHREPGVKLHFQHCTTREDQRQRRIDADEMATSDIYVLADDNCLPQEEEFLSEALLDMEAMYITETPWTVSYFGMLSLWPGNATIQEWTSSPPEHWIILSSKTIEHVSVGGIRFCRKGLLPTWPPMGDGPGYDRIHADALRELGYRVGYFKHLTMTHLGEGRSTVWT